MNFPFFAISIVNLLEHTMKTSLHLNSIDSDKFAEKILFLLNSGKPKDFLFADIVTLVQRETDIESIGLRLHDGPDYPYYVTRGVFPGLCGKRKLFMYP